MYDRIERVTGAVTSISLVATALLLAPAFAGLSPSFPLAVVMAGLTIGAFVARDSLRELTDTPWLARHFETLWIGPLVATVVLVFFLDATPGELKTLGAVVGLLGMFNYLLRPVYFFVGDVLTRFTSAA